MKVDFFDAHRYDREAFEKANSQYQFDIRYLENRLNSETVSLVRPQSVVCVFVNDHVDGKVLQALHSKNVQLVALRCAGFNNVDLKTAKQLGIHVVRVPEYSPHAVAEHALALILTLNRKTHRAYHRVRDGNFSLDGLVGFDIYGKTVGVVGTGRIGTAFAKILLGMGARVIAYDLQPNEELKQRGVLYESFANVLAQSDILSLHVPLTPQTYHMINRDTLALTKRGLMLINTGRGGLIDTKALIENLKSGHLGSAGLDVYEEEEGIFFADHSGEILADDQLARLLTFPNVLITSHQAFLTHEALANIAQTTLNSISDYAAGRPLVHALA